MTIADVGEFGLVARITARLRTTPQVLLGPGDDAAVVTASDGRVAVSTDLLVEGTHFRRAWSTGYDVGRRAAAQNLADIAAMGGRPTALVVGLAAPGDLPLAWAEALAQGLDDECATVGAAVVGGDVVDAPVLTVAVTVLGDLAGRAPVTRCGARAGDLVVLAGRTGRSAAGLALLQAGLDDAGPCPAAYRRPSPPYPAGPALARAGATAMVDVSDGLLADLGHVAAASGVLVEVDADRLPADPALLQAAARLGGGLDPTGWVLGGGEDHALAATLPAGTAPPAGARVIGRVLAGSGVRVVGHRPPARPGFDHWAH